MKRFFGVVLILTGLALYSCATMNPTASVPLPQTVQIVTPDPNLPPEIKAFSGKWGGKWRHPSYSSNSGVDAVFIVEKIIDEHQTVVIYAWGDSKEWNVTKGWQRFVMQISQKEEKIILFSSSSRGEFEIRVEKDKLEGIFRGHYTNFITFTRRN